jgi:hypothetical protein
VISVPDTPRLTKAAIAMSKPELDGLITGTKLFSSAGPCHVPCLASSFAFVLGRSLERLSRLAEREILCAMQRQLNGLLNWTPLSWITDMPMSAKVSDRRLGTG